MPDHVINKEDLNSNLVCLAFRVILIAFELDFFATVDHESIEDVQEGVKLAPVLCGAFRQKLHHLLNEADADRLRSIDLANVEYSIGVLELNLNRFCLIGKSTFFLLKLKLAEGVIYYATKYFLGIFVATIE